MAKGVSEQVPEAVFLIVGDGEQRPLIESKIASLGLKEKVKLLGWRSDIPEILSVTNVFALTSLWEGLPRAALEAFASAKPIAAYETDGIKDIVVDGMNGFIVKQLDAAAMRDKVVALLKDMPFSMKMGEAARKTLDKSFDIDEMVSQQEELYLKLLMKRTLMK
jgi:glycosyltransferase involved in cell wall biosynthesis